MASRNVNTLPRWVVALISLIPLAGAIAGGARVVKQTADATYVRRDTFAIHLAVEARRYSVDSTALQARDARIDTALAALVRACRRRGECP